MRRVLALGSLFFGVVLAVACGARPPRASVAAPPAPVVQPPAPPATRPAGDRGRLMGAWEQGYPRGGSWRYTFTAETLTRTLNGGLTEEMFTYTLDEEADPKTIDWVNQVTKVDWEGIYKFDDVGGLHICYAEPGKRPRAFRGGRLPELMFYYGFKRTSP